MTFHRSYFSAGSPLNGADRRTLSTAWLQKVLRASSVPPVALKAGAPTISARRLRLKWTSHTRSGNFRTSARMGSVLTSLGSSAIAENESRITRPEAKIPPMFVKLCKTTPCHVFGSTSPRRLLPISFDPIKRPYPTTTRLWLGRRVRFRPKAVIGRHGERASGGYPIQSPARFSR